MARVLAKAAAVLMLAGFAAGCATPPQDIAAIPGAPQLFAPSGVKTPLATVMPASTTAANIPPGFIGFCVRFPDQCQATAQSTASSITLTDASWQTMKRINSSVNDAIWPESDEKHYGRINYWTIPSDGYGDCKDYAVTKRKALIDAGFPEPALRVAVVVAPDGELHAVLTVTTDKGDFVLDNMRDSIVAWQDAGYTWLERQDPYHPMNWVSLQQPVLLAANSAPTTVMAVAALQTPSLNGTFTP